MNGGKSEQFAPTSERLGLFLIAALFVIPLLLSLALFFWMVRKPQTLSVPKIVTIEPQSGFREISDLLAREGIIERAAPFRVYVLFRGWATSLRSGTYTFSGEVTVPSVAKTLTAGPADVVVTIPEGFTVFEIDKRLTNLGLIEPGEIATLAQQPERFDFAFLKNDGINSLEGFLFPDTYRLSATMEPEDIIAKFLRNFDDKVANMIDAQFSGESNPSLLSLVTLASIIEKEVPASEDRKIVSGILWRRLELQIPLQVDAAVVYAWKLLNPNWKPQKFALTAADIKINSPYNTYRNRGLPPGPIANPGLDAIEAALNPTDSPYWYYLSTQEGKTIFSETLAEHEAARAHYLER
jgi:UPF0755 protein